jgi:REP element-mobilizing transposase RayT
VFDISRIRESESFNKELDAMTVARSKLVDVSVTPWYHLLSKTVRGAYLLREGEFDRKQWIEDRLKFLARVFAVDVAGFAVLDNHLHVLVRLASERAQEWSDEDVVRRWLRLFPPRGADRKPLKVTRAWVDLKLADAEFVKKTRTRLSDLGWFMKCLKEPLARMANQADKQTGAFWQSRYKSIAILDEEALLATCAYIDLNPLAAGMSQLPEKSEHTSIKARVDHCREKGRIDDLEAAKEGSVAGVKAAKGLESGLWLCPIEDARERGAKRPGLLDGFSLGSYLQLVDYTSRLVRRGKARVSRDVESLLSRIGTTTDVWGATIQKMFGGSLLGVAFAFSKEKLSEAAKQRGCHHIDNLSIRAI